MAPCRLHAEALGHCQTLDSHLFHQPLHRLRLVFGRSVQFSCCSLGIVLLLALQYT